MLATPNNQHLHFIGIMRTYSQSTSPRRFCPAEGVFDDLENCKGLALAAAIAFADAVRQVEVACAERGRVLAQTWNLYTHAYNLYTEATTSSARQAQADVARLAAEALQLQVGRQADAKQLAFLRREAFRFRRASPIRPACLAA